MAAVQQGKQTGAASEPVLGHSFVEVFQLVGQIAYWRDARHQGATFQGVQLALQYRDMTDITALLPTVEALAGSIHYLASFFQEQGHQLRVCIVSHEPAGQVITRKRIVCRSLPGVAFLPGCLCAATGTTVWIIVRIVVGHVIQQISQRLDQLRLGPDCLPGGEEIHHRHQCFVGLLGKLDEMIVACQTAINNRGIAL